MSERAQVTLPSHSPSPRPVLIDRPWDPGLAVCRLASRSVQQHPGWSCQYQLSTPSLASWYAAPPHQSPFNSTLRRFLLCSETVSAPVSSTTPAETPLWLLGPSPSIIWPSPLLFSSRYSFSSSQTSLFTVSPEDTSCGSPLLCLEILPILQGPVESPLLCNVAFPASSHHL